MKPFEVLCIDDNWHHCGADIGSNKKPKKNDQAMVVAKQTHVPWPDVYYELEGYKGWFVAKNFIRLSDAQHDSAEVMSDKDFAEHLLVKEIEKQGLGNAFEKKKS